MVERFERFSLAISEISRCWHRIANEVMKQYELKGAYSVYFTTMSRFPEGLTATQLVEVCGRDKADVSRAMAAMEEKGLVRRKQNETRLYRARMVLTEQGMALAEQINERAKAAVEYASRGLSDEKREVFYEALALITNNMQGMSRDGIPEAQIKEGALV